MLKRTFSGVMISLLFVGMIVLAFNVRVAKAFNAQTVCINADGSVTPAGAPVTTSDNITYTFSGNISYPAYEGIFVNRSNIIIDGNGYTVQGNDSGFGITLGSAQLGTSNVAIRNVNIQKFDYGIELAYSNNSFVSGNNVTANNVGIDLLNSSSDAVSGNNASANSEYGFMIQLSSNNTLSGNYASANGIDGVYAYFDSDNTFIGNNVSANAICGFLLGGSFNNTIYHNNFVNNSAQVLIYSSPLTNSSTNTWDDGYPSGGNYWSDYNGTDLFSGPYQNVTGSDGIGDVPYVIDSNNTDHYPLMRPWAGTQTVCINADGSITPVGAPIATSDKTTYNFTGDFIYPIYNGVVVERSNIIIDGDGYTVQGSASGTGIFWTNLNNVTVENINVKNFQFGIWLNSSSNSIVIRNNITATAQDGIYLQSSSNTSIIGNNATADSQDGIWLYSSSGNIISGNTITNNNDGIFLYSSSGNIISGNTITNNGAGISLYSSCNNNNMSGNDISANTYYGIYLLEVSFNNVIGNNIANSYYGIYCDSSSGNEIYHNNFVNNTYQASSYPSLNVWDDGYPSGGNYWSDYNGSDVYSGPYQNVTGSDGIGDTPYVIDPNNTDNYPLMGPFSILGGTWNHVSVVTNSTISNFQASADSYIIFDVSGPTGTTGFCTITILHSILQPPYKVIIDNNFVPFTAVYENATESVLYVTYHLSTHVVSITSAVAGGGSGRMPYMD
jgi:parallel beta-helix repeat protein